MGPAVARAVAWCSAARAGQDPHKHTHTHTHTHTRVGLGLAVPTHGSSGLAALPHAPLTSSRVGFTNRATGAASFTLTAVRRTLWIVDGNPACASHQGNRARADCVGGHTLLTQQQRAWAQKQRKKCPPHKTCLQRCHEVLHQAAQAVRPGRHGQECRGPHPGPPNREHDHVSRHHGSRRPPVHPRASFLTPAPGRQRRGATVPKQKNKTKKNEAKAQAGSTHVSRVRYRTQRATSFSSTSRRGWHRLTSPWRQSKVDISTDMEWPLALVTISMAWWAEGDGGCMQPRP